MPAKTTVTPSAQNKKSSATLLPNNFSAENVTITVPKKKKVGTGEQTQSIMLHNNVPIYSETPWLSAPFGIGQFIPKDKKDAAGEWSLNMSAGIRSENEAQIAEVTNYFAEWNAVDDLMLQHGLDNSKMIFSKEYKGKDVVEALYSRVVKKAKDETKGYADRLQPKIPRARDPDTKERIDNRPNLVVYLEGSTKPVVVSTFEELEKLCPKGSMVKGIVTPKTWYIAGKFGLSLSLIQLLVKKRVGGYPTTYAFSVQPGEEESDAETPKEKVVAPPAQQVDSDGEGKDTPAEEGEAEDGGEEEVADDDE